jgi:hypothetical protein
MTNDAPRQSLLEELDTRQDELLDELDRLNEKIERALADCLRWHGPPTAASIPAAA